MLKSDRYFVSSIPFVTKKPRRPDARLDIKQLIVTVRGEDLPNFCGNIIALSLSEHQIPGNTEYTGRTRQAHCTSQNIVFHCTDRAQRLAVTVLSTHSCYHCCFISDQRELLGRGTADICQKVPQIEKLLTLQRAG